VIQKDLPTPATPRWVVRPTISPGDEACPARTLQPIDHFFRIIPVLSQDDVGMIEQYRARIARVAVLADGISEPSGAGSDGTAAQVEERMLQQWPGLRVKGPNIARCGLDLLAPVMEPPKLLQRIGTNGVGATPARVIREPPPI
jgi:hypothetical protein